MEPYYIKLCYIIVMQNKKVYVSYFIHEKTLDYLDGKGCHTVIIGPLANVLSPVSSHPDIRMCLTPKGIYFGDLEKLTGEYPADVLYDAACVGDWIVCSRYTDPELIEYAGLKPVFVKQGYVKCNIAVVDDKHVITEDAGIASALRGRTDIEVLKVRGGHAALPGYENGFIGGACGRVGDEIIFNGDLSKHPDFEAIVEFIEGCGLKCVWFEDCLLTDIGSIIAEG